MTYRELISKIGFKVESEPLDKADKLLEGIQRRLEFLAAAEIARGLYELSERFAHFAEELHAAATSAGITVEAFQQLTFAASQSAVSQEEMSHALAHLSRLLFEAKRGGEGAAMAQRAFAASGISPQQIAGFRNSSDALMTLADRFKSIQDPIQKQALGMELLGRGSINMVGFLSKGSGAIHGMGGEAERLGIILSEKQVAALVSVEHSLAKLMGVFKAIGAMIATYLAPIINTGIDLFLKFYSANRKILEVNVKGWAEDLAYILGFLHGLVQGIIEAFLRFGLAHQLLVRRVFEFTMALVFLAGTVFVAQRVVGALQTGLKLLEGAFVILKAVSSFALTPFLWIAGLAQKALVAIALRVAVLIAESFPLLGEAVVAFGAVLEATPVGWFMTAIAALVVVIHDAWKLLTGGSFKDTWIGQAFEAVKGFGGKALAFLGLGGEAGNTAAAPGGGAGPLDADSLEGMKRAQGNIARAENLPNSAPEAFGAPGAGAGSAGEGENYTINAPITIHANSPTGDPKDVQRAIKDGVKEHFDQLHRRMQRSFQPAEVY